jgi:hypothetical protein
MGPRADAITVRQRDTVSLRYRTLCASACLTPLRCVDAVPPGYPSPASILIASSSALIVVITMGADGARPRFRTGAGPPGVLVWTLPPAAALLSVRCEVERVSGPLPRSIGRPGQGISGAFAVRVCSTFTSAGSGPFSGSVVR